jgi:hypothetical protein
MNLSMGANTPVVVIYYHHCPTIGLQQDEYATLEGIAKLLGWTRYSPPIPVQRIPPKPSEVVALLCLGDEVENPEFLTMDLESRSDDAISCGQLASPPRYTRVYRKLGIVSLVLAQRRVLNEKVR